MPQSEKCACDVPKGTAVPDLQARSLIEKIGCPRGVLARSLAVSLVGLN